MGHPSLPAGPAAVAGPFRLARRLLHRLLPLAALACFPLAAQSGHLSGKAMEVHEPIPDSKGEEIQVPTPPFTEGIFPCTGCHDGKTVKPNFQRRPLKEMHDDILLKHGPDSRWCLDCHDAADRNRLHLVNGDRIEFTSSYLLCGQCHGDKLRDWRVGVHGKRTGSWNGAKQYLLCVNCHNPHSPRFKPLKPMPPPVPPTQIRAKKGAAK